MDDDEFLAAFEGREDPEMIEVEEKETPEQEAAEGETPEQEKAEEAAESVQPTEDGADVVTGTPPASTVDEINEPTDPKEVQRMKSWEGRMKAREAELAKREAELAAREQKPILQENQDTEMTSETKQQAVNEAVAKLEDGDDVDSVLAEMAEDFGDDFVKKLGKLIENKAAQIASKAVNENVGKVKQELDDYRAESADRATREHFAAIHEKHPDFIEMIQSGGLLDQYIQSLPAAEQDEALRIKQSGNAREAIKLLDAAKSSTQKKEEPQPEPANLDAAEGVRSRGGLKLPEKPASDDYESAWNGF